MTAAALDLGDLPALLQLSSPALPVGAYSYSQGLEGAIDEGRLRSEAEVQRWIGDGLCLVLGRYEAPVWLRLRRACSAADWPALIDWNERFIATRESRELRAETLQMGYSLMQLLRSLGQPAPFEAEEIAYPTAHAWTCQCWDIGAEAGLYAYLFGWLENQVMAAIKTVPLGQVAGQRMLLNLRPRLRQTVVEALQLPDDRLSNQAPMLGILSSRHESQYSRLFRS